MLYPPESKLYSTLSIKVPTLGKAVALPNPPQVRRHDMGVGDAQVSRLYRFPSVPESLKDFCRIASWGVGKDYSVLGLLGLELIGRRAV